MEWAYPDYLEQVMVADRILVEEVRNLPTGRALDLGCGSGTDALALSGTLLVAEWDRSMAYLWVFDPDDLPTPEQIVDWLPGLLVEKAEVRRIEDMFSEADDHRASGRRDANVAFVKALKATP